MGRAARTWVGLAIPGAERRPRGGLWTGAFAQGGARALGPRLHLHRSTGLPAGRHRRARSARGTGSSSSSSKTVAASSSTTSPTIPPSSATSHERCRTGRRRSPRRSTTGRGRPPRRSLPGPILPTIRGLIGRGAERPVVVAAVAEAEAVSGPAATEAGSRRGPNEIVGHAAWSGDPSRSLAPRSCAADASLAIPQEAADLNPSSSKSGLVVRVFATYTFK